jgi:hypothetical protein
VKRSSSASSQSGATDIDRLEGWQQLDTLVRAGIRDLSGELIAIGNTVLNGVVSAGDRIDSRKKLLALVAGNVAGTLVANLSPSISSADAIATVAVDIAEQILRKAGVMAPSAPSASTPAVPAAAS